jgi:NIMA (never in mitosis gene a)-related kinase
MSLKEFELLNKIGEGAYSQVFKVLRKSDQTVYALKKVYMTKLKPKEKGNALNEIRILASVSHPNVISYKEAFFDNDSECLCIVMEYADGGDLYQRILEYKKKGASMSENFLWHILIKLSRALKVLHEMKIMHRDLKSANVFLTKDGKVKLGDMNVSKVAKEGMNHTQTGTPYYASPEVWRDDPYDVKSDIWSLGCVLYEAAALRPPFQAEDMKSLYKKVIKGSFPPLPDHSEDFNSIISLLLTLDPKRRPSASEILKNPLVLRRVNIKEENSSIHSSLLSTIRVGQNIFNLKDQLPEGKYAQSAPVVERLEKQEKLENPVKEDLPLINKMKRGHTYKNIEEMGRRREDAQVIYYRNLSEKYRDKRFSVKTILKENYGALKLPRVKYPHNINQIRDVSPSNERRREVINMPLLPEKPIHRKIF